MEGLVTNFYVAKSADELIVFVNTKVLILSMKNPKRYLIELHGQIGYVPSTVIKVEPHDFFDEEIGRKDAESLLFTEEDGTFLIRCGTKTRFSLSVKTDAVRHAKIERSKNGQFYIWLQYNFPSLNKLVEYYKRHPVTLNNVTLKKAKTSQYLTDDDHEYVAMDRSAAPFHFNW